LYLLASFRNTRAGEFDLAYASIREAPATTGGAALLKIAMRRVADGEVDRLRSWMSELMQRRDEVIATFENEGVRHELAYLLPVTDGWILVYAMEMEDPERASAAFRASSLPIDHEHKQVMAKVLGAPVDAELLYDVAL
jgi:hypothetical protein